MRDGIQVTVPQGVLWADGYGLWHALVHLSELPADEATRRRVFARARRAARRAIVAELAQREGPNFAPEAIRLRRGEVTLFTVEYVEVDS